MSKKQEITRRPAQPGTLLIGAVLGAVAGLIAANLLQRRATNSGRDSTITPAEGIKLGLLVFGLLRAIASLGDDD